jgi:hypothetical protein
MSNIITVPHTVTFEATIDLDKVPASIVNQLVNLDEQMLVYMCKEATVHAIKLSNVMPLANEGGSWAVVSLKEGE